MSEELSMGNESISRSAMNDTATAEEIDAQNQMEFNPQTDDNMNVEPYHEEKENLIQDSDDTGGFFSFKIIMIIIVILFLLLAIYYFFFRNAASTDVEFEGGSIGGDYEE